LLPVLVALLAVSACRRDEPAPVQAVKDEVDTAPSAAPSAFLDTPPELKSQLGVVRFFSAKPGDYRATIKYDHVFFRSTEASEDGHVTAIAVLALEGPDEGGVAAGCFFADATTHVAVGKYEAADHKTHTSDWPSTTRVGGRGTWKIDARGWAIVSLATGTTCPAPSTPEAGAGHLELKCVGVARAAQNDVPALLCGGEKVQLRDVELPLGKGGDEWTWMAPAPGVAITMRTRNGDGTIDFEAANVVFDATKWK
jgi:hypothetical protein